MNKDKSRLFNRKSAVVLTLILWVGTAWLLYPLINLDTINMENAKQYLYRSAFGITMMLIFFGKTIFDLLFPQVSSRRISLLNTVFLTIYAIFLAGGIIFMVIRIIILYFRGREGGFLF